MRTKSGITVAPSRARGLKHHAPIQTTTAATVAPSRARGLKRTLSDSARGGIRRRAFTGAWVETRSSRADSGRETVAPSRARGLKRYACGGLVQRVGVAPSRARGLKHDLRHARGRLVRRAFTGAWVETPLSPFLSLLSSVAPSRARGLKHGGTLMATSMDTSRLHGRVG